jgi:hypothetical protein
MSFRHVVMFRWADDASPDQRAAAIDALRAFGREAADLGTVSVGTDGRLAEGNFDATVVVELADAEAYRRYATDPRHVAVLSDHVRPIVAQRVAVQYDLDA